MNQTTETSAAALATGGAAAAAVDTSAVRAQVLRDRNAEAAEILAIGKRFNMIDDASAALAAGESVDHFRKKVLDKQLERNVATATATAPATQLGLTSAEVKRFSIIRAANAIHERNWAGAGFERECNDAIEKALGVKSRGFFIPYDVLMSEDFVPADVRRSREQRDNVVGTPTAGGNLVQTNLMAGDFISLLRNRSGVTAMGARMLPGLVGNVAIPRQTGTATVGWVAEQGNQAKSNPTFDQVLMSPHTANAKTVISRTMRLQSTPAIDGIVRDDLTLAMGLAIDSVALNGTGAANQPTGIRLLSGITVEPLGTNGAAIAWSNIVNLESDVSSANADVGTLGYLTNAKQRGKAKQTVKFANTGFTIWETDGSMAPGEGMVNGYRARVSGQVPSTLTKGTAAGICSNWTFGNWADLFIGMWGILDIQVDPFTNGDAGDLVLRSWQDVDIAARHTTSFSIIEDALN